MAIVTVYNRDGTEYGTLDTNQYLFNNSLIGFKLTKLDVNIYPYVKINGVYYINDGGEFASKSRADNSAGLMDKTTSFLRKGENFLTTVTEFMKHSCTDEIKQVKVHEIYEYAKQFSVPGYKLNNILLNGWGYPQGKDSTPKLFHFKNAVFSPYDTNANIATHQFKMDAVDVKTPWVISNYFDVKGGVPIDSITYDDDGKCWYNHSSSGGQQEIILTENTKILMYYRCPAELKLESDPLHVNFTLKRSGMDDEGDATLSIPKQTVTFNVSTTSDPEYYILDLTDAIKKKKTIQFYTMNFFNMIKNKTIQTLDNSNSYFSLFSLLWKPVRYIFPSTPFTEIQKSNGSKPGGWVLTTGVDKKVTINQSEPSEINTFTIMKKDLYEDTITVETTNISSIDLSLFSDELSQQIQFLKIYYAKGLPCMPAYTTIYPTNYSSTITPVDYAVIDNYSTESFELGDTGPYYIKYGYVKGKNYATRTDIRCYYDQALYCGNDFNPERRHYAIVVWDLDRYPSKYFTNTHQCSVSVNNVVSGKVVTQTEQTLIAAREGDELKIEVLSSSAYSVSSVIEDTQKVGDNWKVTYKLTFNGGGPTNAPVTVNVKITCNRDLI